MADSPSFAPLVAANSADWPDWPEYALTDDLLPILERWHAQGRRFALATLVSVRGSSPRPIGAEMAIADDGACAGYVSGGCVEAAVATEARAVIASGVPRLLDYGDGSPILDVRLACGGRIGVFVRLLTNSDAYLRRLRTAREMRQAIGVVTDLADGSFRFVDGMHAAGNFNEEGRAQFCKRHLPALRLLAVGGGAEALALARLAPGFGIEVALLRPHGPALPPLNTQLTRYDNRALPTSLPDWPLDEYSAVYALGHDAEMDRAVLCHALASPAFCVGVLGSRARVAQRRSQLRADGVADAALARLRAPAGLPIGAATPQEIALAILGQIIAQRPR